MNILVTGGTGFLGSSLIGQLSSHCISVLVRKQLKSNNLAHHYGVINNKSNYDKALINIEVLIHCAARAHVMNDSAINALEEFREVNTGGTLNLAQQAASAGVKRFIFISSVKVNGESTEPGFLFRPDDQFVPTDHYGLSKYEAEVGLREIAAKTGMDVVIIRPPLVYGPGVKANFAAMMKWVNKGVPLPLGGINGNMRSLVSVDNLVDLIVTCIDHPNAANQTFMVSDDDDVSTSQLLVSMAVALGVPNRLLPIPSTWFTLAAKLMGKPAIAQRLCGSLQVDISKTKEMLNWLPPYSSAESMKKTADAFLANLNLNK